MIYRARTSLPFGFVHVLYVHKQEEMRSFKKTDDPFTRRKTTPKMVTPLNVSVDNVPCK